MRKAISIHALLAESDIYCSMIHANVLYFYPRSPCGERLGFGDLEPIRNAISIHALLAESDLLQRQCVHNTHISIHALLAESDLD